MNLKTYVYSLVTGLLLWTAATVSAFPLYLTSANGTITTTPHYGHDAASTTNHAKVVAVNLKQVLNVISNEIYLQTSGTNAPPANSRIAFDPYVLSPNSHRLYVTNQNGYYYNLYGIAQVNIEHIATNFRQLSGSGISESDALVIEFQVYARTPDGLGFFFGTFGKGKLSYNRSSTTGQGKMTVTASGTTYGEYQSSDRGVSTGTVIFSGSGTPEWNGPYSVFWWND